MQSNAHHFQSHLENPEQADYSFRRQNLEQMGFELADTFKVDSDEEALRLRDYLTELETEGIEIEILYSSAELEVFIKKADKVSIAETNRDKITLV